MTARLPLDFPGLREEASRWADRIRCTITYPSGTITEWRPHAECAEVLRNLENWESQCFWLRALAIRQGHVVPLVGAPSWQSGDLEALRLALHAAFGVPL
jgi:hypothetical protein